MVSSTGSAATYPSLKRKCGALDNNNHNVGSSDNNNHSVGALDSYLRCFPKSEKRLKFESTRKLSPCGALSSRDKQINVNVAARITGHHEIKAEGHKKHARPYHSGSSYYPQEDAIQEYRGQPESPVAPKSSGATRPVKRCEGTTRRDFPAQIAVSIKGRGHLKADSNKSPSRPYFRPKICSQYDSKTEYESKPEIRGLPKISVIAKSGEICSVPVREEFSAGFEKPLDATLGKKNFTVPKSVKLSASSVKPLDAPLGKENCALPISNEAKCSELSDAKTDHLLRPEVPFMLKSSTAKLVRRRGVPVKRDFPVCFGKSLNASLRKEVPAPMPSIDGRGLAHVQSTDHGVCVIHTMEVKIIPSESEKSLDAFLGVEFSIHSISNAGCSKHAKQTSNSDLVFESKNARTGEAGNISSTSQQKVNKDGADNKLNLQASSPCSCKGCVNILNTRGGQSPTDPILIEDNVLAEESVALKQGVVKVKSATDSMLTKDVVLAEESMPAKQSMVKVKYATDPILIEDDVFPGESMPATESMDKVISVDLKSEYENEDPIVRKDDGSSHSGKSIPERAIGLTQETNRKEAEVLDFSHSQSEIDLQSGYAKERVGVVYSKDRSADASRLNVVNALKMYNERLDTLIRLEKAKKGTVSSMIYIDAAMDLKKSGKWMNLSDTLLGSVPGVILGDRFRYRAELAVVGLHCKFVNGIDTMKKDGKVLATCIVESGRYANSMSSCDVLIYSGEGGKHIGDKQQVDQKLQGGNLALYNSMHEKTPVRVVYGVSYSSKKTVGGKPKKTSSKTYIYDGLYYVTKCWQEKSECRKLVYKFELRREGGQARVSHHVVEAVKPAGNFAGNFASRRKAASHGHNSVCVTDISNGKEKIAIPAVNTVDDEKPPSFDYLAKVTYPNQCSQPMLTGCDCTNGCTSSCACAAKNGGQFLFNAKGAIDDDRLRPIVYECGPSCKCSSSCLNRVSQHGIRFPLEVFKTEQKGWGVRSRAYIPKGSFICEYVGELISEQEAEERVNNFDYLFDIGRELGEADHKQELPHEETGFTLDAASAGNVGRFINHSCWPSLYVQNVLYDHEDKRMPHVMLFTLTDIPPKRELTYDYNCALGEAFDEFGNMKMKYCYCGSKECRMRLY